MVFYFVILKECIYLHDAFAFAKSERDVGGSRKVRPCGVWQLYASRQFSFRHLTKYVLSQMPLVLICGNLLILTTICEVT
jgi:hypothetical protein